MSVFTALPSGRMTVFQPSSRGEIDRFLYFSHQGGQTDESPTRTTTLNVFFLSSHPGEKKELFLTSLPGERKTLFNGSPPRGNDWIDLSSHPGE